LQAPESRGLSELSRKAGESPAQKSTGAGRSCSSARRSEPVSIPIDSQTFSKLKGQERSVLSM